ncbi:MAG: hypothetical protein HY905_05070 [Deltaproteobacteria bacterium]|nr:hypothetical protein [Deltaproteobacteria bacterium]
MHDSWVPTAGRTRAGAPHLALLAILLVPAFAAAQSEGGEDAASFLGTAPAEGAGPAEGGTATGEGTTTTGSEGTATSGDDASAFLAGQEPDQAPVIAAPEQDPELELVEQPDQPYFLLGLRSHALFVPDFLIQAFGLQMFETVYGWAVGPEFTYRKNGFDIVASVWWGSYPVDTPSREDGDTVYETEIIKSTLGLVWFTVDFIAGYDFEPWVALVYGGGFGFGVTTGEVTRTEAYQTPGGGWAACDRAGVPNEQYCELSGGHYGPIPEKAKGIWPVYPMIHGTIGARFKPLRNLVITPEFGVGIPELFTLGLRANYMF